ncbi:unnamed protein product [Rhizoctonia solani]|uniref:Peptidyl-prolyl cis-trans isomerase n=1 Tax=Rhizoctonia solani TaxID=456999 RepID=A0A8H3E770_9AGAM|nr:unnamed protein product [Rhizoctonia solani]
MKRSLALLKYDAEDIVVDIADQGHDYVTLTSRLLPSGLGAGWEVRKSNSRGVHYFYNPETKESRWEPPEGFTEEQVKALPGAAEHIKDKTNSASVPTGQMRASHLLVKHSGSRRPSSWKEENITRSKDDAIKILEGYAAEIGTDPIKFAELATEYSDCSSHRNGGDLGVFGKGQMQKPFEDGVLALEVGGISGVVETDSGVHLIMRTG